MMRVIAVMVVAVGLFSRLMGQENGGESVRIYVDKTASPPGLAKLSRIGDSFILGEVGRAENFQLVESSRLDALLAQQKFQQDKVRNEEVVREAQLSGAQWVVFPELLQAEGVYSFSLRMVEIESGRIAALAQDIFSERKGILPAVKRVTRAMLRDFSKKEGVPIPHLAGEDDSPSAEESVEEELAGQESPAEPIENKVSTARLMETMSWHFSVGLGGGFGADARDQVEGALLLAGSLRTGPMWLTKRNVFAPHFRYRLSLDLLAHGGGYNDVYMRDPMHHLGFGLSLGWLSPDGISVGALFLGFGVDWLRLLEQSSSLATMSLYLGYEISGRGAGVSFELGISPPKEFSFVWFNTSLLLPSPFPPQFFSEKRGMMAG